MNAIYPVGSIYTTISKEFKPATTFGGTWQKIASGRCLWGANTDGSNVSSEISAGLPKPAINCDTGTANLSAQQHLIEFEYMTAGFSGSTGYNGVFGSPTVIDRGHSHSVYVVDDNIYSKSETVQPPAFTVIFWQRIT